MPISFTTTAHRVIFEKVGCYLAESGLPFETFSEVSGYRLTSGSARAVVQIFPAGEADASIAIVSAVVEGARVDDPALLLYLLRKNAEVGIGVFSVTPGGNILFGDVLMGSSCSRDQLVESTRDVLATADKFDDEICAKWGGRRSVEPPLPEAPPEAGDAPRERAAYAPTASGIGDGKAVFFLFGFRVQHAADQSMLRQELEHIDDDIATLRGAGYRVVVNPRATRQDYLDAISGKGEGGEGLPPAAIYWSGHGSSDGSIQTCDEGSVVASEIDPAAVSPSLRLMIFASCYVGNRARSWRKALGGRPLVVGWGRPVTIARALSFLDPNPDTDTDLDDLIRRYLLSDTPIPEERPEGALQAGESVTRIGSLAGIEKRLAVVVEMLGGSSTSESNHAKVTVPLEAGRFQIVKVCVTPSSEPYSEGEALFAVESEVGALSAVVEPMTLLSAFHAPGYARLSAVKSEADAPTIVVQGFLPLARARDQDLASLLYQVGGRADALELSIFGTNDE